jgi:hypothetical protein
MTSEKTEPPEGVPVLPEQPKGNRRVAIIV